MLREEHHEEERAKLIALLDRFQLRIGVPEEVDGSPGGPFSVECATAPITRVPVGGQAARMHPSTLDYYAASLGLVEQSRIIWDGVPADHALIAVSCKPVFLQYGRQKRSWHCDDDEACLAWLQGLELHAFDDALSFNNFAVESQQAWCSPSTCKERRRERMPLQLRDMYAIPTNETL